MNGLDLPVTSGNWTDGLGRLPRPNARQADVIYLDADRDQVVLGTAGSGKTLMALHRAVYLSDPQYEHSGTTLLVTFNRSLVSYLEHLLGPHSPTLEIRHYHHVARGYLAARGLMNGYGLICEKDERSDLIARAVAQVASGYKPNDFFRKPVGFFIDELDWIAGHGFRDQESYLAANRVGRVTPLQKPFRQVVWSIREAYHALRAGSGRLYDWWDLPSVVRDELQRDNSPRRYRHVVIDEAQDLPPEAIRSLVEMSSEEGTTTLFADYAQQLYGQRTSYASCGLRITQVEKFAENYRNSVGIANLALAITRLPHFTDSADIVVPRSPTVLGTPPTLFRAASGSSELREIRAQAMELAKTGTVAVLGRTWPQVRRFVQGIEGVRELRDSGVWTGATGIYVGTYHSAKGLEFDSVVLPWVDDSFVPDPGQVRALGLDEALERDARLLYVGVTRARSDLIATFTEGLTAVLPAPDSGLWAHVEEAR